MARSVFPSMYWETIAHFPSAFVTSYTVGTLRLVSYARA